MMNKEEKKSQRRSRSQSHMPDTDFYEKVVPLILIGLGALTVFLILAGLGIAFGIIPY